MSEPREDAKLHRGMGFWGAFATAVGLVVAGSTMVSLGSGFGLAGMSFAIAALAALLISILIAFSYSELANMLPGAGMIADYTAPALGRALAIFGVMGGYVVVTGAVGSVEALTAGGALNQVWPSIPILPIALIIPTLLMVVNLIGVEVFGKVQLIIVILMIGILTVFGLIGFLEIGGQSYLPEITYITSGGWGNLTQLVALAIFLYVGFEYVCPMSEEVRNPARNIPMAMIVGLVVIFIADTLFGAASVLYVAPEEMAGSATPHLIGAEGIAGRAGLIAIALATVFAGASSLDASLAAVSRMLYGLAREGMIPSIFGYVHPRFRTPWIAIFAVFCLQVIPLLTFARSNIVLTLILIATVTWLVSYIIVQVDVMVLRRKYPDIRRGFRTPFYPLPQIIGIAACLWMIIGIHPDPGTRLVVWLSTGGIAVVMFAYAVVWLKFVKQLPLFKPVPLEEEIEAIQQRSEVPEGAAK